MSKKILVVDDEASVRELISSSVENFTDYDVDVAEDGFEAVKKVMSSDYDLIMIDIKMPKMNGIDAVKAIQIIKKQIPILVITGFASEDEKKMVLDFGAKEVLTKPFAVKTLIDKVKAYVEDEEQSKFIDETDKEIAKKSFDKVILIGSSVGGPEHLKNLFSKLDKGKEYPPIIVIQHMPEDFIAPVVETLASDSGNKNLTIAKNREQIKNNQILFANSPATILIEDDMVKYGSPNLKREGFQPSISDSFINITNQFKSNCLTIVLSGVSAHIDSEEGIVKAKENNSLVYALDEKSSLLDKFQKKGMLDDTLDMEGLVEVINNFC